MSKYFKRSKENRFKDLEKIRLYTVGSNILIIHKSTGIPFCGQVNKVWVSWDVNGKVMNIYDVWIEEIGRLIDKNDTQYEVSNLGYF